MTWHANGTVVIQEKGKGGNGMRWGEVGEWWKGVGSARVVVNNAGVFHPVENAKDVNGVASGWRDREGLRWEEGRGE